MVPSIHFQSYRRPWSPHGVFGDSLCWRVPDAQIVQECALYIASFQSELDAAASRMLARPMVLVGGFSKAASPLEES